MMRDPIIDAAQDPSCLLCLTPDRGGSWWSRLRPPKPRNFAADPMTFTDSYTAQDGIGTDDFTLSVDFTLLNSAVNGEINIGCMRCAYYNSSKGYQPGVHILNSDGTVGALYPVDTSHIPGDISSIKVIKTGQNVRAVVYAHDGSIIRDQTKPLPDGATVTSSSGVTNYPGNILSASIRNDTTGTAVWQAAHSDLYTMLPPPPWPSSVPENFAEKAKAFYDYQAAVREVLDPTHDYSFLIDFKLDEAKTSGSVFYATPSAAPFALVLQSNNQIDFFTNLLKPNGDSSSFTSIYAYYQSDVKLQGRHQIECKIEANMLSSYLDGVLVAQKTSNLERTGTAAVGLPNCNSGYVYKIQITDLTDNQVVWSYPSEAERVRLITKTNVRTDRGAFEAADETQPARVDTALDLRGKVSSYTVVVDFEAIAPDGTPSKMELAGQGASVTDSPSICALAQSGATGNIQLSQEINGIRKIIYKAPDNQLGRHVAVGVVDVGNSSTRLAVYYDGDLLAEDTVNGLPTGTCDPRAVNWAIFDNRNGFNDMRYGKIYSALLFDRALSAAEIAALTPKKQPLSWAGIREGVRRGRAQRYFAVGDVLTVATPRWDIEYEVTGFDQVEPADAASGAAGGQLAIRRAGARKPRCEPGAIRLQPVGLVVNSTMAEQRGRSGRVVDGTARI